MSRSPKLVLARPTVHRRLWSNIGLSAPERVLKQHAGSRDVTHAFNAATIKKSAAIKRRAIHPDSPRVAVVAMARSFCSIASLLTGRGGGRRRAEFKMKVSSDAT